MTTVPYHMFDEVFGPARKVPDPDWLANQDWPQPCAFWDGYPAYSQEELAVWRARRLAKAGIKWPT